MEEDKLETFFEGTIYTHRTIVVSSFFGGFFAGCYMIYKNFKTFGDDKKARQTILYTVLGFIFIGATAYIPAFEKIPGLLYTLFFTLLISLLTKKFQGTKISKHIDGDGKIYSTGNAVAVCVISLLIFVAIALAAYFLQDLAYNNQKINS